MEENKIYQGDCLELMKELNDNSVDLIVTDPPYNIGKDFENENLSKEDYLHWCSKWIPELNRVLKWGGAIYITLGWQYVAEIKQLFNSENELRLKNWIIWYRQCGWKGDNGFAHSHEHILYFIKDNIPMFDLNVFGNHIKDRRLKSGYKTISSLMDKMGIYKKVKRTNGTEDYFTGAGWFETGKKKPTIGELSLLNKLIKLDDKYNPALNEDCERAFNVFFNKTDVCDDVWVTPKSEKNRLGHPTQKPVKLFQRIIKASSNKGDLILDPFIGSGTTAWACKTLERNFIGFELEQKYIDIANKRLTQGILLGL